MIFFALQNSLVQTRVLIPFSSSIFVSPPHAGQVCGISILPLFVLFSASCGMIILALYTTISSPIPNCNSSITLMLWRLALLTVVPSNSTGSKIATGLISPVLDGLHSISVNVVSAVSSAHLNAMESLGNLAVLPRLFPYARSS